MIKRFLSAPLFGGLLFFASLAVVRGGPGAIGSGASIPSFFAENQGQVEPAVRFLLKQSGSTAYFSDREVRVFAGGQSMLIHLVGSAEHPTIEGRGELSAKANFFEGNDASKWKSGVSLWEEVVYRELWSGIDMIHSARSQQLKSEFLVRSGSDPAAIRWNYGPNARLKVQPDASLEVSVAGQIFREGAPEIYQDVNGERKRIEGAYRVSRSGTVSFDLGTYDPACDLVIDPVINYATFLGGSGQDNATAVASDPNGNMVIAGWTSSANFPATGSAKQKSTGGGVDAFVAKLGGTGNSLIFCTYLGGKGDDPAFGVAVDPAGNIYVTGRTASSNFPVTGLMTKTGGSKDAFVTKLNAAGSQILYSTYLGGSDSDSGNAIAVDPAGNAYIVGDTLSMNFPLFNAYQSKNVGGQDAFVAKINPAGTALVYSTYLGGHAAEHAAGLAVNASGNVYLTGSTFSPDYPVVAALQPVTGGNQDAFVTELAANGSSLLFSTFLGGSGGTPGLPEVGRGIVLDAAGNIYVSGVTSSLNFPVTSSALQAAFMGGNTDGFLSKLTPQGAALSYSSYLAGSGLDSVNGLAIDPFNYVSVVGYTSSQDFPNIRGVQKANGGQYDGFVTKFDFSGTTPAVVNSTYLGGAGSDSVTAIALDKFGDALVAGFSSSTDFPVSNPLQGFNYGIANAIALKLANPWFPILVNVQPYGNVFIFDSARDGISDGQSFTAQVAVLGLPGDIPVSGDWNGSGVIKAGIFRNGTWMLDWNGNGQWEGPTGGDKQFTFGQAGDTPMVGDWTGDGKLKAGLFRAGQWTLDFSGHMQGVNTGQPDKVVYFGAAGHTPIAGDWNGDGRTKIGTYSYGWWYQIRTEASILTRVTSTIPLEDMAISRSQATGTAAESAARESSGTASII